MVNVVNVANVRKQQEQSALFQDMHLVTEGRKMFCVHQVHYGLLHSPPKYLAWGSTEDHL